MVNFYAPRQVVLDIGRASSGAWGERRDTTLVNLWWAAWVTHALVVVASRLAPEPMALLVVAEALMIAAAVPAALVVERVTALQNAALRATVAGASPAKA
ncbi:DUF4328 domain-containing protein [Streptomyces sp. NPDC001544]|uniref:DUF4328 domain-containing protein n=1 Tax=Streptomyces sp. NPDC001544 TaxID=3364584 RepID=UPI003675EF6B